MENFDRKNANDYFLGLVRFSHHDLPVTANEQFFNSSSWSECREKMYNYLSFQTDTLYMSILCLQIQFANNVMIQDTRQNLL